MTKMKDPKDILKEIKADIAGVTPDEITFSNFRNRKKKKVDKVTKSGSGYTIIDNKEGFGITGKAEVETCSYSDIGKRRRLKEKNSLEEWGAFDFFIYTQKEYVKKYGRGWDLNIGGSSLEINRIRDKFYDLFGFCCNLIMRDYINFFIVNYMDRIISTEKQFYFSQMRRDNIMCEFCDGYDFPQSFLKYSEIEKKENKDLISNKEIKESYQIGDTSLVSNYGIVLSLNWLIKVKKNTPTEASRMVLSACRELADKDMVDVIKSSTELYSPYPSFLPFKSPQMIMDRIDKNIKLEIEFSNNDKYEFLQ